MIEGTDLEAVARDFRAVNGEGRDRNQMRWAINLGGNPNATSGTHALACRGWRSRPDAEVLDPRVPLTGPDGLVRAMEVLIAKRTSMQSVLRARTRGRRIAQLVAGV